MSLPIRGVFQKSHIKTAAALTAYALAFGILLTSCGLFPKEAEVLAPPLKEPPKVTYSLVEAKRGNIENTARCSASFVAVNQSELAISTGGNRLRKIHVASGDIVKKGDLLVETDSTNLESQIHLKELEIQETQNSRTLLRKASAYNLEMAEMDIANLKHQIANAKTVGELTNDLDLQLKKTILNKERDQTDNDGKIQQMELSLQKLAIQLDDLKKSYTESRVVSPIDGEVIYIVDYQPGDYIDAYRTLVTVADPSKLQLRSSDADVGKLEIGMEAIVSIDGNDDITYMGKVTMTPTEMPVNATEEEKKRAYFTVEGIPAETEIGTSAVATVMLAHRENVIVLPKSIVHTSGSQKSVQVMSNGVKKELNVETGLESGTDVEIVKGLNAGDKVIDY
jgi:macrolide-specific efflux system membrane fusion protein